MKRTTLTIALALVLAAQTAAKADTRIVELCGPDHVNEAASDDDVRPNPAGYYVTSLREQVSEGDPSIVLGPDDDFYLCTRTAATPNMDSSKALLLMKERVVKYLSCRSFGAAHTLHPETAAQTPSGTRCIERSTHLQHSLYR